MAALLCACTVFALSYLSVTEHFTYKSATNTYRFADTASMKKSVTIPINSAVSVSLENTNAAGNDHNYNYALILAPNDPADVQYLSCDAGTRYAYGINGYSRYPDGAVVYEGIDVRTSPQVSVASNCAQAVDVTLYVVRDSGYNCYVGSYFDLQMSEQEYFHNFSNENVAQDGTVIPGAPIADDIYPFIASGDFANVYVIGDFTVPETYTYRVPCFLHLLDSTITLDADLTLKHGYSGLFSIATLDGQIDNSAHLFGIYTPKAYYKTENVSGFTATDIVTTAANFTKVSENLDLSDPANAAIKGAVLSDADLYIEKYLKHTMFEGESIYYIGQSVLLPDHYYNYGVRYEYSSANAGFFTGGTVERAAANTLGNVTASVYFGEEAAPVAAEVIPVCVVGTDNTAVREAYVDTLGVFVTQNQPAGADLTAETDLLYQGIDLRLYTERYADETAVSGTSALDGATLCFNSNQLFCEVPHSAGIAELNAVTLSYDAAIGVSGLADADAIILKHDYYICSTSETMKLSYAGLDSQNRFSVSFVGVSMEERNRFFEREAPQVYIGALNTVFDVINIQDTGVYCGTVASGERVNPTNLSATGIDYSIYYMNEAALTALTLIQDSDTLTRVEKSSAIEALLDNDLNNPYLSGILTAHSLSAPLCATSYAGSPLLGTPAQNAFFSLSQEGELTMNAESFEVYGGVLVLVGEIGYDDGEPDYLYHLTRTFYSPASGLGGTNLGYTESGLFSDVFSSDRNWCAVGTETLAVDDPARWIKDVQYTITTPSGGTVNSCDYFEITPNGDNRTYTLRVTKENIPTENSIVNVTVVITDGSTDITETYSFIIHGIYLYGIDIPDIWVYLRMCQVYGEWSGYLRADDLARATAHFDCSFATLNTATTAGDHTVDVNYLVNMGIIGAAPAAPQVGDTRSIEGIQYLKNTARMTFDHLKTADLSPFAKFDTNTLTQLSMSDCGLSTAMLRGSGAYLYPLYRLNKLITADLSENSGITSLANTNAADADYALYRTVTHLDVDGCALTTLDGLERLVQLETLECRGNAVQNFDTLCEVESLNTVYLGGNPTDASGFYGTHGKVNLCNIVNLVHQGVAVYTQNGTTDKLVVIYEYNNGNYYLKGQYTPTSTINNTLASTCNILQNGGYLITLEQEYLGVAVRSFFNFAVYNADVADTSNYAQAIPVMFPSTMSEYASAGADFYQVTAIDLNPASTSTTRSYRISIQYSTASANPYRFAGNYTAQEVANGAFMEVWREITFDVNLI